MTYAAIAAVSVGWPKTRRRPSGRQSDPASGQKGAKNIPHWRFDLIRSAITDVIATGEVKFAELMGLIQQRLDKKQGAAGLNRLERNEVKLELDVRSKIKIVEGKSHLRLMFTLGVQF